MTNTNNIDNTKNNDDIENTDFQVDDKNRSTKSICTESGIHSRNHSVLMSNKLVSRMYDPRTKACLPSNGNFKKPTAISHRQPPLHQVICHTGTALDGKKINVFATHTHNNVNDTTVNKGNMRCTPKQQEIKSAGCHHAVHVPNFKLQNTNLHWIDIRFTF